ncbi:MAG: hypothetical protein IPL88_09600 [Rhizobiales bacterium]|nr:hypothetical protein [Hyphomicrobiales bacterium]
MAARLQTDAQAEFARERGEGALLRPDGGADLGDIVGALRRGAWIVALAVALATGMALAYLVVAKTLYTASTSILIDARSRAPIGSDNQPTANTPDAALVESQVKVISSDTVLRRVVESEKLYEDEEFAPTTPGLRTRVMALIGLARIDAGPADMKLRALESLGAAVTVKRSERTYVIDVEAATRDPLKSARIANAIARAYIEDLQAASSDYATRTATWLKSRLEELQSKVEAAERKAQAFRETNGLVNANGKSVSEQELADIAAALTEARSKTAESKSRYEQTRKLAAAGRTPDGVGDALKSGVMEKLRAQYAEIVRQEASYRTTLGPRHPAFIEVQQQLADTRRLIQEEARRLVDVAASDYQAARENEAALAGKVETAKGQSAVDGKALVQLRELEREVEASRVVYEKFLRARETVREDTMETPLARVIAPAVAPVAPSSPKKAAILVMALAAGLGLGSGGALVADYFKGGARVRRRRAPSALGGHPDMIGALPPDGAAGGWWRRALGRDGKLAMQDAAEINRILAEARSDGDRLARSVLVTSAQSDDCVAAACLAFARAAAGAGQRVLVVDGDRAAPTLAELVSTASAPALVDFLGQSRVVYPVAQDGATFHVMPILRSERRIVRRIEQTLGVRRIAGLRESFDLILFAGPPASGADFDELCAAAERCVVLVDGDADAEALDGAIDAIEEAGGVFAGAVALGGRRGPGLRAAA